MKCLTLIEEGKTKMLNKSFKIEVKKDFRSTWAVETSTKNSNQSFQDKKHPGHKIVEILCGCCCGIKHGKNNVFCCPKVNSRSFKGQIFINKLLFAFKAEKRSKILKIKSSHISQFQSVP